MVTHSVGEPKRLHATVQSQPDNAPLPHTVKSGFDANAATPMDVLERDGKGSVAWMPSGAGETRVGGAGARRDAIEAKLQSGSPDAPPMPEVTALLAQYGVQERLGRPRERIVQLLQRVQAELGGTPDAEQLVDRLIARNSRLQVFYLEGILKLYRKHPEYGTQLEPHFRGVKQLEDLLGQYSGAIVLTKLATEHGLPQEAVERARQHEQEARGRLLQVVQQDWMPDNLHQAPAIKSLVDALSSTRWDGYKQDRKFLIHRVAQELHAAEKTEYHMDILEGFLPAWKDRTDEISPQEALEARKDPNYQRGLHPLRRDLRWFCIFATATDGLFIIDPNECRHPVPKYKKLLVSPVAQSPYARLPVAERESKPVPIARSLYLGVTKLVDDVSKPKDVLEEVEVLATLLRETGHATSKKESHTLAAKYLEAGKKVEKKQVDVGEELYEDVCKLKVFKKLRQEVEAGLGH